MIYMIALTALFAALQGLGVIDWPWWVILMPLYIIHALYVAFLVGILLLGLFAGVIGFVAGGLIALFEK